MNLAKENIAFYLPSIMHFIPGTDPDWNRIDNLFNDKLNKRFAESVEKLIIDATIFDIIVEVKKQNRQAIRLLDFFNKVTNELSSNLNDAERKLVAKNIKDILVTLDKFYVNYVGEIAILNNLMKSKEYKLEAVEAKLLDSTKTIDFKVAKIKDNTTYLVEVLNIHLDADKIEEDQALIKKFLTHRLTNKIESKKTNTQFYLIPVLWSGWEALKIYSDYFKSYKMHIENVIEPFSYLTFIDPNDDNFIMHRFSKVSNLFS